jgi:hypothetical protein
MCWPRATIAEFEATHGRIPGGELVVLGLGRLGGGRLTHASDLDIVYLFTGDFGAESDGRRPLGATLYFNRLAQRISAALSVPTAEGALYEVDTRLRPQGTQGRWPPAWKALPAISGRMPGRGSIWRWPARGCCWIGSGARRGGSDHRRSAEHPARPRHAERRSAGHARQNGRCQAAQRPAGREAGARRAGGCRIHGPRAAIARAQGCTPIWIWRWRS